ncbi:uncharacterized protein LOC135200832 isoform X2 [Macrobrachium nipponense]
MRGLFVLALVVGVSKSYGPPPSSSSGNGCGGGGGGCGGVQPLPAQTVSSCGGRGCGSGGGSSPGGSGDYWWAGNDSPFSGPPATHVVVSSSSGGGSGGSRPAASSHQRPQPQQGYIQPSPGPGQAPFPQQPLDTQNLVQPPMGICPASFVCVHWQLCRDGYVISDGTGNINKLIKTIPANIASRYESCGGDMICCGIPAGTILSSIPGISPQRPSVVSSSQPLAPAPQPALSFPAPQPAKPAPAPAPQLTISAPSPQPGRPAPAPQPLRPAPGPQLTISAPAPQPARPAPGPQLTISAPAPFPGRPAPAPQPARPALTPQTPSVGYGRPSAPQNPLIPQRPSQPNPQPTFVNPANPVPQPPVQPQSPISNPIGLVSPPSPQPNPMMGGMMMGMMGMPMRGGSCSAGTYCVQPNQCNPYTGFIIRDPSQLMAVWPDSPTVPLLPCFVPDGSIQNGVCCQEAHPNAGGFD